MGQLISEALDPYSHIAGLYDSEHAAFMDDIHFYCGLTSDGQDSVLETGCGTGRIAIQLSQMGYEVTGIDISTAMLEVAQDMANRVSVELQFDCGDMRCMSYDKTFDLAIVALDSFSHLLEDSDQSCALERLHKCLNPGGKLAVDVFNPNPYVMIDRDGRLMLQSEFCDQNGLLTSHFVAWEINPDGRSVFTRHYYDTIKRNGDVRRVTTNFELRCSTKMEIEGLMRMAGFRDIEVYGDYDESPYSEESERMIFVAVK